jgi:hypothetical protein
VRLDTAQPIASRHEFSRARGLPLLAAAAFTLALAVGLASSDARDRGARQTPNLDALFLGDAQSPVLGALREDADIHATRAGEARDVDPRDYDLLVVDGDVRSPGSLRSQPLIAAFVNERRWVLALDVEARDRAVLDRYTGFGVSGDGHSEMFLFGISDAGAVPRMQIVDSGALEPGGRDLGPARTDHVAELQADRVAALTVQRIEAAEDASRLGRAQAAADGEGGCGGAAALCAASLQKMHFQYTRPGTKATPNGYWIRGGRPIGMPSPGEQVSSWTLNHFFDVYLENDDNPVGDNQVITYRLTGTFTPASEQRFFMMWDWERAWWTGFIGPSINPNPDAKLVPVASEPQTANTSARYTVGRDFSVGITAAKPDAALALNANWTVSESKSYTIRDWAVQNKSGGGSRGNSFSWQFSARNPCDVRPSADDYRGCFERSISKNLAKPPPEASKTSLDDMSVYGRWTGCEPDPVKDCSQPLSGQQGKLEFSVETPIGLIDTYCPYHEHCGKGQLGRATTGPALEKFSFDAGALDPCPPARVTTCEPVAKLKLFHGKAGQKDGPCVADTTRPVTNQAPINGFEKERVVGQVTLARKVENPLGVKVILYSDQQNAQFDPGQDIGEGRTRAQIKIPEGKDCGEFQMITNANGLACAAGEPRAVTVTISPFYAKPGPKAQVDVIRPASSCK